MQDLSNFVDLELMASRLDKVSIIEKKVDELTRHLQQATSAQNSFARPPLARETVQNIYHQSAKGMDPYPSPSTSRTRVTSDPFYSSWGNSQPSYSNFPEVPQNCEDLTPSRMTHSPIPTTLDGEIILTFSGREILKGHHINPVHKPLVHFSCLSLGPIPPTNLGKIRIN